MNITATGQTKPISGEIWVSKENPSNVAEVIALHPGNPEDKVVYRIPGMEHPITTDLRFFITEYQFWHDLDDGADPEDDEDSPF